MIFGFKLQLFGQPVNKQLVAVSAAASDDSIEHHWKQHGYDQIKPAVDLSRIWPLYVSIEFVSDPK